MITFAYYGNFGSYNTETYIASALERAGFKVIKKGKYDTNLVDCDYLLCAKLSKTDILINKSIELIDFLSTFI